MNTVQTTNLRNSCEGFFDFAVEKLSALAECIRAVFLRILQTILPCYFSRVEPKTRSIEQITENQIQDVAEKVAVHVMKRVKIGMLGEAPIPNLFNRTTSGEALPVYGTRYDPNCDLLKKLKPIIASQLKDALSNRDRFMERGVNFTIHNPEGTGPVPTELVHGIMEAFELKALVWEIHLSVNRKSTEKLDKLCFEQNEFMNGAQVANTGFSLDAARASVKLGFVNTFEP